MPRTGRGRRGRRAWPEAERVAFACRLYRAIVERYGSFERFKKQLTKTGVRTRESTVRGWLGPLERLKRDPAHGAHLRAIDKKELVTPDLPQLIEVAHVLDVALDWLATGDGGEGPMPRHRGRTRRSLAADLYLEATRGPTALAGLADEHLDFNGALLFGDLHDALTREAALWAEWERNIHATAERAALAVWPAYERTRQRVGVLRRSVPEAAIARYCLDLLGYFGSTGTPGYPETRYLHLRVLTLPQAGGGTIDIRLDDPLPDDTVHDLVPAAVRLIEQALGFERDHRPPADWRDIVRRAEKRVMTEYAASLAQLAPRTREARRHTRSAFAPVDPEARWTVSTAAGERAPASGAERNARR